MRHSSSDFPPVEPDLFSSSSSSSSSSSTELATSSSSSSSSLNCPSGYREVRLYDGLVAHWKMNDNAGNQTVIDSTGRHNGTWIYQNTSASSTSGKINRALIFDGINDYMTAPNHSDFNNSVFTFSAWLNHTGAEVFWDRILSKKTTFSDSNGYEISLDMSDSGDMYISGSSRTFAVINAGLWVGTGWHHLVVIFNGNRVDVYRDNVYKGGGAIASVVSNTNTLKLGRLTNVEITMWDGVMDDVRIYNKILSEDEIAYLYNHDNGTEDIKFCYEIDSSSSSSSSTLP